MWNLLGEWDGTRDGVHDVRHELNLLAGSLVTVAYRLSEMVSESSLRAQVRDGQRQCIQHREFRVRTEKGLKVFVMS